MKSEATEDISAGLASQEALSEVLSEAAAKETTQGEQEEENPGGDGDSDSTEHGCPGCLPLTVCCVCLELEHVRNCVRSEKICILPILACLLSLALCTAGLKWVFVDKIFEYEPPSHLDLKRIGQDPNLYLNTSSSVSPPNLTSTPTTPNVQGQPNVFVEGESTGGPFVPPSPKVLVFTSTPSVTIRTNPASPPNPKSTFRPAKNDTLIQYPSQTLESNDIIPRTSATSTTTSAKTSSHVTRCSESERNYCVNGGECFTLEVTPGNIRRLCRCPNEFTGDRCQNYVMASFYKHLGIEFMEAEELYQKRVLTITGICIALLVVGIMCVVAYCKTKKQRKKLHDRLRQSLRERNAAAKGPPNPPPENLQLVNHYMTNSAVPPHLHAMEKEAETSLSTNDFITSVHPSTSVTNFSSSCWSKTESVDSDSHTVTVNTSVENCRHHVTPVQRGRLNATGGSHQNSREPQISCSERYVPAITTPIRLSPVGPLSPVTPSSPPSEMSAPLSSLATSIPSMATSPSGEDERPLLFRTPPIMRDKSSSNQARRSGHNLRNSAHYNHGLDLLSPPASPLHIEEDGETESSHNPSERTQQIVRAAEESSEPGSGSNSASSSSESEDEDTPFLGLQNPLKSGTAVLDGLEGNRTNPVLHLSPQDHLQSRLTSVMVNQDPIAV
ncbi:pro-neuregulin-1, membrane-bound isoform isoform X4 [Misgurnus anguillicaudatus]|uniref:pro-neuregulin-1, membrane-bound isoform isoform X4 n=1 Tax=Misgurnus anguillicaudatus TaxID=75329 RepID=UPI003CCF6BCD